MNFVVMRRCHIYIICRKVICLKTNKVKVSGCSDLVQCAIHDRQYYEVQMPQAHRVVPTTINMGNHSWKAIEIIYETYVHYVIPVSQSNNRNSTFG